MEGNTMKKNIVTNKGENIVVESLGYKDIIYAYKTLGTSLWRTIWQSEETCKVIFDGTVFDVKRKFINADGEWFELDQQNRHGCGYGIATA